MEKKQSSFDYLFERFYANEGMIKTKQLEQAKAMHKQEIFDAYDAGVNFEYDLDITTPREYYNETFGGNNGK